MKDVDRQELNNATSVTYALVMALLDEFDHRLKSGLPHGRSLIFLRHPTRTMAVRLTSKCGGTREQN
jgi:hypothetical protein